MSALWSPAECGHCGYEVFPAKHAAAMGWEHEHAPTGWVHNQDMTHPNFYCECGGKDNRGEDLRISHHHAHPADNRSVEQEEHGANELMVDHDFHQVMKGQNLGKQFDL
jgi:hypothetical protein